MLAGQRQQLISLIETAVGQLLPQASPEITLERPKVAAHGDIACNVAMRLARTAGRNPRELAQDIVNHIMAVPSAAALLAEAEVAGPGFINFRLTPTAHQEVLAAIRSQGEGFGHLPARNEALMVEFVSANPTGPLHVGHARQAALGDALCRIFQAQGFEVTREFYYNDAGNQIDNLARSVQARAMGIGPDSPDFPSDGYRGDYVQDIAHDFLEKQSLHSEGSSRVQASGDVNDLDNIRLFAVAYLRREQDRDLQAFGLQFDNYYLESSLYTSGRVQKTVDALIASGHTYELDDALWLRTSALGTGDDKDRVMRKRDGSYTYFVPDVAYHVTKWERGFRHAINIQGSDHHGTVARVRAGLQALDMGIPASFPAYIMHKMVKVMRDGSEVKISKRAGSYITMRDLIDWVGQDAVRFFLIQRRADSEFVFDVDLARSKTEENPVYYVQYAHARICSILDQCPHLAGSIPDAPAQALQAPSELALLRRLAEYPATLATVVQDLAPHHLAFWLRDCAADFHAWYNAERVLVDDAALQLARLRLAYATRTVLANGLGLLGVSAPVRM